MRTHQKQQNYTYADYCQWDDSRRWELVDGAAYALTAPGLWHQRMLGRLFRKFDEYLDGKECEVFMAPCDVRLNADKADNIVVQPDLLIVCDPEKLADGKAVNGAPDLIIEISSPSTSKTDNNIKLRKYREAGVKEYWIVSPDPDMVRVHVLKNHEYVIIDSFSPEEKAPVGIFPGFKIDLAEIFDTPEQEDTGEQ